MEWAAFGDRGEEGLHWTWPGERLDTQGRGPQHKDCMHTELREISGESWSWTERAWDDRAVGGTMGEKTRAATASWAAGCLCEMG